MLNDIIKQLKILSDNKINDTATLNLLNAMLTHVFSFKAIKFLSVNNITPIPLAYYAFNFVPSGGVKDKLIRDIDNNLLLFFQKVLDEYNEKRLNQLKLEHTIAETKAMEDKAELNRLKREHNSEVKQFRNFEWSMSNATLSSLYQSATMIDKDKDKKGSLYFENTEFVGFFEDMILHADRTKKDFFNTIYNLYDGDFSGTNTTTTQREKLKDIPLSCAFLSAPELLVKNQKIADEFRNYLGRGIARRSFIYFNKNENYYKNDIYYPTYEEKQLAMKTLRRYSNILENIYNEIPDKMEYIFSEKANNAINEWKKEMDKKAREFTKYTDLISEDSKILRTNLENSTWKIIKLATLYHILSEHNNPQVQLDSFEQAKEFFNKTHECLENLLNDRVNSETERLYTFLIENMNRFVSRGELGKQNFVKAREFKNWYEEAIIECSDMAEKKGLIVVERHSGKRNQSKETCLYDPNLYQFNMRFEGEGGKIIKGELVEKAKTGMTCIDKIEV